MVDYAGNLAFGAFLVLALVLERGVTRHRGLALDLRWTWAAVGCMAVAFAVWNTAKAGSPLCWPTSVYQGHGVWHLLCALATWCLFRLYVTERPVSSPTAAAPPSTAPAGHS